MSQYRVRLQDDRVIGPFVEEQILELYFKDHIDGREHCQEFPAGDWLPLSEFSFWKNRPKNINNTKSGISLGSILIENQQTTKTHNEKDDFPKEFKFNKEVEDNSKSSELSIELDLGIDNSEEKEKQDSPEEVSSNGSHEDKTVITPETLKYLEEEQKKEEENKAKKEQLAEKPGSRIEDDKTQVLKGAELDLDELRRNENELFLEAREKQQEAQKEKKKQRQIESAQETSPKTLKKKNNFIIIILGAILAYAILFPEEKEKKQVKITVEPVSPVFNYPVPFDQADRQKSKSFFEEGQVLESKGTYLSKIKAADKYRLSFENDNQSIKALESLIRVFGELIDHSLNKQIDGGVVFKLMQAHKNKSEINANICLGLARFYYSFNKKDAAYELINDFVNGKVGQPSTQLFAFYLQLLDENGITEQADKVYQSLLNASQKNLEVLEAFALYHLRRNDQEKFVQNLKQMRSNYPDTVRADLLEGDWLIRQGNFQGLKKVAKNILELKAEKSKVYYAKYLKFLGYISAYNNDVSAAAKFFDKSLNLEMDESFLRKLSQSISIENVSTGKGEAFLKKIKSLTISQEAKDLLEERMYQQALLKAIKATSLSPTEIRPKVILSEIQAQIGQLGEAIKNLEELYKDNSKNEEVVFALLDTYLKAYKTRDAKKLIAIITPTELRDSWRFASANAKLYEQGGDRVKTVLWLQKSINLNPLNDKDIFRMAKTFIEVNKFKRAKNLLFKAIELDPRNIVYRMSYAEILYETQGVDQAIGYLLGLRERFPGEPSIMGEVAVYYYRAGLNKEFKEAKKDFENLPQKDPRVYQFLIRASVLEEKYDDAIRFMEELNRVEPGDLASMMYLGKVLMDVKRYKEATRWFVKVKQKLPTYPRVGYYRGKIELLLKNYDQAIQAVTEDININGEYVEGRVLLGDIYIEKKEYSDAEKMYKEALKLDSNDYSALVGLARLSYQKNQYDVSLDLYRRAIGQKPNLADAHKEVAEVYRNVGQSKLAIEEYKIYLNLVPDAKDKDIIERKIKLLE